jgi:hypothetical protein
LIDRRHSARSGRSQADIEFAPMEHLITPPRWPLYARRCQDWTAALKQLDGEYRQDRFGETMERLTVVMFGLAGAYLVWATTIGPRVPIMSPWDWLLPTEGLLIVACAGLYSRRFVGVRYLFRNGDIRGLSPNGDVLWCEPIAMLQNVSFPWTRGSPPLVVLHFNTRKRAIVLLPSIAAAVEDIIRHSQPAPVTDPPDQPWHCGRCGENCPDSFDVCWKCGAGK